MAMGKFKYVAVDQHGNYVKGVLESPSQAGAVASLRSRGLWPVRCFDPEAGWWRRQLKIGGYRGPRVKTQHFTVFCRQLVTLYRSGIHMVEALKVLGEQSESKVLRKVLLEISEDLQQGAQLSAAVAKYPTVFNAVFVNMVRAGEASGNLDEMLNRVALYYEKEHSVKEKVKSAMVYPVLMGIIMVGVLLVMMLFIIPQFVDNFLAMGLELPWPTRMVMAVSEFVRQYWYVVIAALFLPGLAVSLVKKLPSGPYVLDYVRLKIPVFGGLWQKQALARFSRVFSSLYGAAIPLLAALTVVANVVGNRVIQKVILDSREQVRGGQSIAEPYRHSSVFPPMIVEMLATGEKSGSIDVMMDKVAEFYEEDIDQMTERLKAALEPIMITVMGVVVGGIVLATMLPVFQLFTNLQM